MLFTLFTELNQSIKPPTPDGGITSLHSFWYKIRFLRLRKQCREHSQIVLGSIELISGEWLTDPPFNAVLITPPLCWPLLTPFTYYSPCPNYRQSHIIFHVPPLSKRFSSTKSFILFLPNYTKFLIKLGKLHQLRILSAKNPGYVI